MIEQVESAERSLWEGHTHVLEDVTHMVGGVGLGLLLYSSVPRDARNIGFVLVAASLLMHLYALMTARTRPLG